MEPRQPPGSLYRACKHAGIPDDLGVVDAAGENGRQDDRAAPGESTEGAVAVLGAGEE